MEEAYTQHDRHYVAVDCIIFGFDMQELKLLCIKRELEPEKGQWSLVGGFLGKDESLDEAAYRILYELTGISDIYLEQLQAYGAPGRDRAARVVSIAYFALVNPERIAGMVKGGKVHWFSSGHLPDLLFDHRLMVEKAMRRLQRRCRTQPVGFELLPEKFTLPQLQHLYESIFGREFDKRNFRKKILSQGILSRLEEKEKESSRKGAYLYEFDKLRYRELMKNGYTFEL